jgi:hypothetical protein
MKTKEKVSKLFALFMAIAMVFTIPSLTTFAGAADDEDALYTDTTTGIVSTSDDENTVTIESYLTHKEIEDISVKPCDVIFVLDQSKWMNTEANKGAERAAIMEAMKDLVHSLNTPSYGEHRVAIVGYGRLNMWDIDPYDPETYPGVKQTVASLNTGYYTKTGFKTAWGWGEVSDFASEELPTMPNNFLVNEKYDDLFMSVEDADEVINPDTMRAWFAAAARMDAGLTMTKQIAKVAKENDPNNDRELIVCMASSSIPIQNNFTETTNTSSIRDAAALSVAKELKEEGARIYAFGDYHNSGKTFREGRQDTYELFDDTMSEICGALDTPAEDKDNFFFSLADYSNIADALNDLITHVNIESVGVGTQKHTISVDQFKSGTGNISVSDFVASQDAEKWQTALESKTATVSYYRFTGYENGEAQFESTPITQKEVNISDLFANSDSAITYQTNMMPVPPNTQYTQDNNYSYGQKVVITFSVPKSEDAQPEPTLTPEPTVEPNETPEPTLEPIPTGEPIDLNGIEYAYIFGYEPHLIERVSVTDDEGNESGAWNVEIRMAPEEPVTREQVAAMIMRTIDQKYNTTDVDYPVTDNIAAHAGTWYERGLAYIASTGAFDGIDEVNTGNITRGEVARLVAYGLNLSDQGSGTKFEDIADSPYKQYIEIMEAYGYMQGVSDTEFDPDRVMTRAEFCSMFNQIIGREDARLEAADGTVVTPELYYFIDLPEDAWYTPVMLRATSAYDKNGYVDIETRLANIRNTIDKYDSQKLF